MGGVLREYGAFHEDALVAIPEHLSFEEAREALKYMEGGSHFGKVVIAFES
ncbi:MAG: zinc-binding dehydrogenase [Pyrinomonadaceae bacterium]